MHSTVRHAVTVFPEGNPSALIISFCFTNPRYGQKPDTKITTWICYCMMRPNHACGTKSSRSGLQIFDEKGRIHHCSLVPCKCEPECVTLLRHNLWPASTKEPKVAFHAELMNWLEFLLIESAVSLQSACLTIRWKNGLSDS